MQGRGLKKNQLFAALKWIPNTAYREMMKIYSYIYRCIYNIYKKILRLLLIHSLAVHRTMRKHCKFICSFFFCKFFFSKVFFSHVQGHFSRFIFLCVCMCVWSVKIDQGQSEKWPWPIEIEASVNLSTSRFFCFCLHDVHPHSNHTRLYSFKLSCKMVSLTAANTKRILSVSEKYHNNKITQSYQSGYFPESNI